MIKSEIVDAVKQFCQREKYVFVADMTVGNNVLVCIRGGANCVEKFNAFLNDLGQPHDTPCIVGTNIESYIKYDR